MYYPLLNKFKISIESHLEALLKPLVLLDKKINQINLITAKENFDRIALIHYWLQIEMYLKYANGGIGYDTFVAKRFLSQMLSYSWILSNTNTSETEQETCETEIKLNFYILLNCIYNIKEKWHKFMNFDKRDKLSIISSVLNNIGETAINKKLDALYKDINRLCSARDCLVHDISSLHYDKTHNTLIIKKSRFTLSNDNVWETKKTSYQFNLNSILHSFEKMDKHRMEILLNLSNPEIVDNTKLKKKYQSTEMNGHEFGLT